MLHYILMYYTLFQHHLQVPYPHTSLYIDDAYTKERIRKKERSYNKIDRACRVGWRVESYALTTRPIRPGRTLLRRSRRVFPRHWYQNTVIVMVRYRVGQ